VIHNLLKKISKIFKKEVCLFKNMLTKSKLAIVLSKLKRFENPKVMDEQYETDSETAATMLWSAYMNRDIEGKTVADFGCGTGILGIGAVLLGAERVYMIEKDKEVISTAEKNVELAEELVGDKIKDRLVFLNKDIDEFKDNVDTVIQNPPFGVKRKHADKSFLEKAFQISTVVYSLHKIESVDFLEKFSKDSGFSVKEIIEFDLPIKATFSFHKRRIYRIKIACWRFKK